MKPIYKSLMLEAIALSVTLSLKANVTSGEDTATQAVQAESLEGLKVGLISPNVSGVRDLLASGEATLDENHIAVNINGLSQGVHRLQVSAVFGTQTVVLYALDITVPTGALERETQEYEDEIVVVSTFGDGASGLVIDPTPTEDSENPVQSGGVYTALAGKADTFTTDAAPTEDSENPVQSGGVYTALAGKADATVYAKYEENAYITKPLSVCDGDATGAGAIAGGNTLDGASIQATGAGAIASGYADGEVGDISATGDGSQAFGMGTRTQTNGQTVLGKCNVEDVNGDYALIVGNGAGNEYRSNAFAIDWNGNLVLFNNGTPVVLTPAKLAQLIA